MQLQRQGIGIMGRLSPAELRIENQVLLPVKATQFIRATNTVDPHHHERIRQSALLAKGAHTDPRPLEDFDPAVAMRRAIPGRAADWMTDLKTKLLNKIEFMPFGAAGSSFNLDLLLLANT
jgi:hypothetical protein